MNRLHIFQTCWCIEKQILNRNICSFTARCFFLFDNVATFNDKVRTRCIPVLVMSSNSLTDAILGSASPRKPSVRIRNKSFSSLILLVACRSKATMQSSSAMPSPLSIMRILDNPASSKWISIDVLFASMEFSTSSFTTEAGRSTTSLPQLSLRVGHRVCEFSPSTYSSFL